MSLDHLQLLISVFTCVACGLNVHMLCTYSLVCMVQVTPTLAIYDTMQPRSLRKHVPEFVDSQTQ